MWKLLILQILVAWITIIQGQENATDVVNATTTSTEVKPSTTGKNESQEETIHLLSRSDAGDTNITADLLQKAESAQTVLTLSQPKPLCTFPDDLVGDWQSTLWGKTQITESEMVFSSDISKHRTRRLECFSLLESDQVRVVLRSVEPFRHFGLDFYWFTCLDFERHVDDFLHVVVQTGHNKDASGYPVMGLPASRDIRNSFDDFCQSSYEKLEGVLIRQGREKEVAQGCPKSIQGTFKVTYTSEHTKSRCEKGAILESCDVQNTLVFNYSSCHENATQEFTNEDVYYCMEGEKDVLLYREPDEENAFTPFSCLSLDESETKSTANITAVLSDHGCGGIWKLLENQPSDDEVLILTKTDICEFEKVTTPVPTTRGNTTTTEPDIPWVSVDFGCSCGDHGHFLTSFDVSNNRVHVSVLSPTFVSWS